jgi:hypothetical protein
MNQKLMEVVLQVHQNASDMRIGQLFATLGLISEEMTGRTLWDIDDDELLLVVERFRQDLLTREERVA